MRDCYRVVRLITNPPRTGLGVDFNNQIEVVMFFCPFAELQHLRKFVGRIDVQDRKGNTPEKSLARKPDKNV